MLEPLKQLVPWIARQWQLIVSIVCLFLYGVEKLYPILKGWLGLRKVIVENKKTELEIKKLEKEDRLIAIASDDEIKRYDLKTGSLIEKLSTHYAYMRPTSFLPILAFLFLFGWLLKLLLGRVNL
jgi:hypothetical protein